MLIGIIVLSMLAFYPRTYNVPVFEPLAGTQFWELPTGSRIGYQHIAALGEAKPFPIIYLHGGPGGCIWQANVDRLRPLAADGYEIYLYDQVGSGSSERLDAIEEYTVDRHTRDLAAIVDQLGAAKVILFGQSWGAMLATQYIALHPDKVAQIIFTGPGPILPMRRELAEIPAPDSLHLRAPMTTNAQGNAATATLRSRTVEWWATARSSKLATDAEADAFMTALMQATNKSMVCDSANAPVAEGGGGYYAAVMTVNSFSTAHDPRPALRNCKIPTLILKGQCDNQKWGYLTEYLELFVQHKLVSIPEAGHAIAVEQPETYLRELRLFLADSTGL